ncbi:MaoC/PaaZ C-terminal domain-containing protein [Nocardia sp. NPDC052254]|uniref:MaoC/PaaZ C-terminal domain-containing protein n=1 Tax=Nocardia sp. NPDC052254 TaxID=3155681 RepID=UPI00344A7C35
MPIDRRTVIGVTVPTQEFRWGEREVLSYRRAVGQRGEQTGVLPTFAMTAPVAFGVATPDFYHREPPEIRFPGIALRLSTLLHLEQELEVRAPLPDAGFASCRAEVVGVEERRDAAVLVQRTSLTGADGQVLVSGLSRIHARGEGVAGGAPSRSSAVPTPEREPDLDIRTPTHPDQALRYQGCVRGAALHDNVHTDAEFARAAGFPGPILQGVCTYGVVCTALVDAVLDADVSRVHRYTARFRGIVFPGESLRTRIWSEGDGYLFDTSVPERGDRSVLSGALIPG